MGMLTTKLAREVLWGEEAAISPSNTFQGVEVSQGYVHELLNTHFQTSPRVCMRVLDTSPWVCVRV